MFGRRETRSLDIRRQSFDRLDRRRSAELCSTRRYDEHWGAAEKADTRLKCGDGVLHHVHSQLMSCWSPVLRDMINLYPTPHLLESTHGLAYLLHVEEDSSTWAAVLDMMYPVPAKPMDWDMLERCLVLADKYDMGCLVQRITGSLLDSCRAYSMDPSQPNFALRWLSLAEQLQLPEVAAHIMAFLKSALCQLGSQPTAMSAVLSYAQEHLSKDQLLQLLQVSMQAANTQQQAQKTFAVPQQQQPVLVMLPQQVPAQQTTISMALQGWLGGQQDQQQRSWPVSMFNEAPSPSSCSGTSSPASGNSGALYSDEASSEASDNDNGADSNMQDDAGLNIEQQRLAMCMSSGLFAPAALPQQQAPSAAAAAPASTKAMACPVPRFPVTASPAFSAAPAVPQQRPRQPVPVFGMQADARAPSFGFGVNAGSTSIADWMCNSFPAQPEGMCT